MNSSTLRHVLACAGITLTAGCSHVPITLITTQLDPVVVTLAATQGKVDPINACNPAQPPAPVLPHQWWNSLPVTQLPKVAGYGVVGFERWRNLTDACQEFRQDLYRTVFSYDLTTLPPLKGLISKAELSFSVAVMPAVQANTPCQAMSGGGGSLLMLLPGSSLPQTSFVYLGTHVPPQPFPASIPLFAMTFPWLAGQIVDGVVTTDGGGQRANFVVDMTERMNSALNRADASMGFMLSGSDEVLPTVSPVDSVDCRTVYRIGHLVITHY